MDDRIKKLSKVLTTYSCDLKPGDNVLIAYEGEQANDLVRQLIKDSYELGARPFLKHMDNRMLREILLGNDRKQIAMEADWSLQQMKEMDAYIGISSSVNAAELSDVPIETSKLYDELTLPALEQRVNGTKWVILNYPNPSMAQLSNMSQEAFEDYFFNVCTMDYGKMSKGMDALVDLMNRTDKVSIKGPDTDLTFSIKDIPAIKCDGKMNIPDGEVYTAPIRDSVNGVISYNVKSENQGFTYENISFEVKNGKITSAKANNTERINALLDTDEGARYFGEFAIGVNPFVTEPMNDILFDEKICGSFHLTPGMAYDDADNGNRSSVHWDLVMIQRPEYGGGEIWFDDLLIRKDGQFVLAELECLNPEILSK